MHGIDQRGAQSFRSHAARRAEWGFDENVLTDVLVAQVAHVHLDDFVPVPRRGARCQDDDGYVKIDALTGQAMQLRARGLGMSGLAENLTLGRDDLIRADDDRAGMPFGDTPRFFKGQSQASGLCGFVFEQAFIDFRFVDFIRYL